LIDLPKFQSKSSGSTTAYMFVYAAKSKLDELASAAKSDAEKSSASKNGSGKTSTKKSRVDPDPGGSGIPGLENLPGHLRRLVEEDLSERRIEVEKHEADQVTFILVMLLFLGGGGWKGETVYAISATFRGETSHIRPENMCIMENGRDGGLVSCRVL
jgi:hypothetical protein